MSSDLENLIAVLSILILEATAGKGMDAKDLLKIFFNDLGFPYSKKKVLLELIVGIVDVIGLKSKKETVLILKAGYKVSVAMMEDITDQTWNKLLKMLDREARTPSDDLTLAKERIKAVLYVESDAFKTIASPDQMKFQQRVRKRDLLYASFKAAQEKMEMIKDDDEVQHEVDEYKKKWNDDDYDGSHGFDVKETCKEGEIYFDVEYLKDLLKD